MNTIEGWLIAFAAGAALIMVWLGIPPEKVVPIIVAVGAAIAAAKANSWNKP